MGIKLMTIRLCSTALPPELHTCQSKLGAGQSWVRAISHTNWRKECYRITHTNEHFCKRREFNSRWINLWHKHSHKKAMSKSSNKNNFNAAVPRNVHHNHMNHLLSFLHAPPPFSHPTHISPSTHLSTCTVNIYVSFYLSHVPTITWLPYRWYNRICCLSDWGSDNDLRVTMLSHG